MEEKNEERSRRGRRKKKRIKHGRAVLLVLFLYLLVLAAAAVLIDGRHPEVTLLGPEELTLEYGESFDDPGAQAVSMGRVFGPLGEPLAVPADGELNTRQLGLQRLCYTATQLGRSGSACRTVHVVDTTPPTIELLGEPDKLTNWLEGYEEEGFIAHDKVDGDLTAQVLRTELEDRVIYTVADSSGNETTVERPIHYSIAEPAIKLIGGEEIEVPASLIFEDPGYEAVDAQGNDLSDYVVVSGEVIPYQVGSYLLDYAVVNERGDAAVAQRTVKVVPASQPETYFPTEKTIYLTFDDGPGPYTARLLDVLAAYGVKATFFVTNQFPDYADMIGRAYREGHSIGVHSYTHLWNVYSSEEDYFQDFLAMEGVIYQQTGAYTSLFRFPGGSSNTISRDYCYGIMSRLTEDMTNMGYVYFDWNVSSGDAGSTTDSYEVYQNVINGCSGMTASVVLQHDIKDFSVAAVENIINWGLSNGYRFAALDEHSFGAHHGTNN